MSTIDRGTGTVVTQKQNFVPDNMEGFGKKQGMYSYVIQKWTEGFMQWSSMDTLCCCLGVGKGKWRLVESLAVIRWEMIEASTECRGMNVLVWGEGGSGHKLGENSQPFTLSGWPAAVEEQPCDSSPVSSCAPHLSLYTSMMAIIPYTLLESSHFQFSNQVYIKTWLSHLIKSFSYSFCGHGRDHYDKGYVPYPSLFYQDGEGGLGKRHTGSWFLSDCLWFFGYKILALGYVWLDCNSRNNIHLMSDLCQVFSPGLESRLKDA